MNSRNNLNQIFWGLVIILVGVLFLVQTMGLVSNFDFWKYLPAVIILLGIYQLIANQFRAWVGPVIFILLGSFLLLASLDIISWSTFGNLIWPTILIFVGLSLVFRRSIGVESEFNIDQEKQFNLFAAFSGQKRKIISPEFSNGELTVMFGGCEIDLTEAKITTPPARIQATVLFGGSDLFVPQDWDVRNEVVALFGGVDNKRTHKSPTKNTPDLIVTGTVLFGGLTIKD
jgi:predicted membrane protein